MFRNCRIQRRRCRQTQTSRLMVVENFARLSRSNCRNLPPAQQPGSPVVVTPKLVAAAPDRTRAWMRRVRQVDAVSGLTERFRSMALSVALEQEFARQMSAQAHRTMECC